jgi:hypothetical protein
MVIQFRLCLLPFISPVFSVLSLRSRSQDDYATDDTVFGHLHNLKFRANVGDATSHTQMPIDDRGDVLAKLAAVPHWWAMPDVPDLELWKIKTPVRRSPRYNLRSSEASAPNNNDTPTLENLLENIKSSDIGSHAEYLDEAEELIDCFREENRENKIQALVLCPRMPLAVAFVRSH